MRQFTAPTRSVPRGRQEVPDLMAKLREAEIRARIRQAREEAGLSRETMADLLTVHWRTVENYEKKTTPWGQLDKIASITDKPVEWLLHGEGGTRVTVDDGDRLSRIESLLEQILAALSRPQAQTGHLDEAELLHLEQSEAARKDRPARPESEEESGAS